MTVTVKDNIGVDGMETWAGSAAPLPSKWTKSGSFVQKLQSLGAVINSKSHCAEFALGGSGLNPNQGTPLNPYSPEIPRVTGGSSSGTAVAVASGMAMLGVGTDTGGSVRVPAGLCGCVGYRASYGKWPMDGVVPLLERADCLGLFTQDVQDLAIAYSAIESGPKIEAAELSTINFAQWPDALLENCDADRQTAFHSACRALRQSGATTHTIDASIITQALHKLSNGLNTVAIEFARFLRQELPEWSDKLNPEVHEMVVQNATVDEGLLQARNEEMEAIQNNREALFGQADIIISPTTGIAAPKVSALETPEGYQRYSNELLYFTVVGSLFGCCGISVPAGLDRDGLPIGLQILARPGDDEKLIAAALAIVELLPTTPRP